MPEHINTNLIFTPVARFMKLKDYIEQHQVDKIEFGPNNTPPFYYAKFYKNNGELILKTLLSEALRNDLKFYDRLIHHHLSENPYQICFNGHNGLNYLTQPGGELIL